MVAALQRGTGLGGYLSAVPDLIERLEKGTPPPEGVAVVRAAADWYRSGLTRPAPTSWVRSLYLTYLPGDDITLLTRFDAGIAWATEPVSGARLLTQPTDGSGLAVHDSVLEYLSATVPAGLPKPTWRAIAVELTSRQSLDELTTVGITAYRTHADSATAEHLLHLAADTGHAEAANNLGVLLEQSGRAEEAERWYRAAADTGHAEAANNLGVLLERSGRAEEAERWYRAAADTGHAEAANNLGVLLERSGRAEEAERWYRAAADTGHAEAANNLGVLLERSGRAEEAERWYRAAADTGHAEAANNLGVLLERSGRAEEAERWYRAAADTGHAEAANNLGVLLEQSGRAEEAERWYRAAADTGHAEAANNLGVLLEQSGRAEEAERWYRAAADTGHAEAANNLGVLLERSRRAEEAERWYRAAAGAGHADADLLAELIRAQWSYEMQWRRVFDPYALPVRWIPADPSLSANWAAMVRQARDWPAVSRAERWGTGPDDLAGEGRQLADVLARVPTGRLMVLGGPGSGKTTLMVRLVLEMLDRRTPGAPVPFLVAAASWDPSMVDLGTWLADQMSTQFPVLGASAGRGAGRRTRVRQLLERGLILPILDGLDEIPDAVRGSAIARINDSLRPGGQLVITCRTAEFRDAVQQHGVVRVVLSGAAAIELCPLEAASVARYRLIDAGGPDGAARWAPVIAALDTHGPLAQVLSSPLMIQLASVIYNPHPGEDYRVAPDPAELCIFTDAQVIEARLLDAFIPAAYRPYPDPAVQRHTWSAQQAEQWLEFLARHLEYSGTTDLAWWDLRYLQGFAKVGVTVSD